MRFVLYWSSCLLVVATCWVVQAGPLAQFRTVLGEVDVELYDTDKPATVQNFIQYVQSGAYRDGIIHRWEPFFVIQGGGYFVTNRNQTNATFVPIPTFPNITNEYRVGRIFSNTYGTIAMARQSGETNSANSQWFINLTNNAGLDQTDGGFTVFGRVVAGTNVLERFNPIADTGVYRLTSLAAPLDALPVLSRTLTFDTLYQNVVYVDVTLLHVQVSEAAAGAHAISWDSVSNRVNRVQFTTQMPPVWNELVATNGNGQSFQVLDSSASADRFYRVIVDF